jgi:hypothetical protein
MTSLAASTVESTSAEGDPLIFKLAVASSLAAFAEWLFYGEPLGLSVAIFALALLIGTLAVNPVLRERRRMAMAAVVFVAGLIPIIEELGAISFILLVLALATSVAIVTGSDLSGPWSRLVVLRDLLTDRPLPARA